MTRLILFCKFKAGVFEFRSKEEIQKLKEEISKMPTNEELTRYSLGFQKVRELIQYFETYRY